MDPKQDQNFDSLHLDLKVRGGRLRFPFSFPKAIRLPVSVTPPMKSPRMAEVFSMVAFERVDMYFWDGSGFRVRGSFNFFVGGGGALGGSGSGSGLLAEDATFSMVAVCLVMHSVSWRASKNVFIWKVEATGRDLPGS